jgi:Flp pilus assembly protein TadD
LNNLAYVLLEQGKPGALPLAEKAVSLSPKTASMMDTLSLALASEKQFAKALETQREAMRLAPEMHSLRVSLARIYLLAGDKVQARKELEAVKALGKRYGGQAEVERLLQTTG